MRAAIGGFHDAGTTTGHGEAKPRDRRSHLTGEHDFVGATGGVAGRGDTGFGSAVRGVAVICLPWVRCVWAWRRPGSFLMRCGWLKDRAVVCGFFD